MKPLNFALFLQLCHADISMLCHYQLYARTKRSINGYCTPFNSTLQYGKGGRSSHLLFEDLINIEIDTTTFSTYTPLEEFDNRFNGMLSKGDWTLAIHDELTDGITGMLHDYSLDLTVDYCKDEATWSKLSNFCDPSLHINKGLILQCPNEHHRHESIEMSQELFTPRYLHSTIAVRDDIYIFGGFAFGIVPETWRFNYLSKTFTRLNGVHSNKSHHGRMSVLTPYGIIAIGGIDNDRMSNEHEPGETLDENVYLYSFKTQQVSKLGSDKM